MAADQLPPASLEAVIEMMRSSLDRRPEMSEFASAAGMSRARFHVRFRQRFGRTPLHVIAEMQIERVKQLLREGVTPAEASDRCGFTHQSHMTARFKMLTGTTPVRWLRGCRSAGLAYSSTVRTKRSCPLPSVVAA